MTIAFLFPGPGLAGRRDGPRVSPRPRRPPRAVCEEADDALGFSLSRLCFEGPEAELALTANTQPARADGQLAAAAAAAPSGASLPSSPRATASASTPRSWSRGRCRFARRGPARAQARRVHAGGGAGGHRGDGRAHGRRAGRRRGGVRGGRAGRGRRRGQHQLAGADRDRRPPHRGGARGGAAGGARRQQERDAAGERALPLRADEAGRRSPRRGLERVAVARRACPVVRNVDAGLTTDGRRREAVPGPTGGEPGALDRLRGAPAPRGRRRVSSRWGRGGC